MIQKAFNEAKNVVMEQDILEKDFIDILLAKAVMQAKALEEITAKKEEGEKK